MGQEAEERVVKDAESIGQPPQGQPPQGQPPQNESAKKPLRISSPEQVDDYIRVTTPGMWLLVVAMVVLLLAGIIWAFASRVEIETTNANGQVQTERVVPASFLTDGTIGN